MPTQIDLLVTNGNILTMDSNQPSAEAFAVKTGRIIAIGTNEELSALKRQARHTLDLHGATVVPGFIDSHTHFAEMGTSMLNLDLSCASSAEDALGLVKTRISVTAPGNLILGYNLDESSWPSPRFLTKKDLDPIAPHNPVVLIRICGHLACVNSLALQRLDINLSHPGVDRNPVTGEATGVLRDIPIDPRSLQKLEDFPNRAILEACRYANSIGITSIHENLYLRQLPFITEYLNLRRTNQLTVRVYCNLETKMLDRIAGLCLATGFGDDFFRLGGVKAFIDGSLGAQTAAITQPYDDMTTTNGMLLVSEDEYRFILETSNKLGLQVNTHAIGDRAIELLLRCHEQECSNDIASQLRHSIIHAELLTPPLLQRTKKIGTLLLMQPNFVHRWGLPGGMYDMRLGPIRAQQLNNFRHILDAGIRVAFGSDCMPMNPLYGIYAATTHPNPATRITIEEALRCYTIEAAYASFEEKEKGSLTEGKLADFVVLSENPLTIEPKRIQDIRIEKTFLGGVCVFSHI
ncbi:MAG: amidohydrolase [Promethearchaeota archaeon]